MSFLPPAAAAGASLLAPGSVALGGALSGAGSWLAPGGLGFLAWQGVYGWGGAPGIALLRALIAASAVLLVRGAAPSKVGGVGFGATLASAACFGLLLPWGPGALLALSLAAVIAGARRFPVTAGLAALAWPLLDPLYWLGAPLAALLLAGKPGRRWAVPLAAFVNPVGLLGLVRGAAAVPLLASWIGMPGFAAPSPLGPVFWIVALTATGALLEEWSRPERRTGNLALLAAGLCLRPASPLAPLGPLGRGSGARELAPAEDGAPPPRRLGVWLAVLAALPAAWLALSRGGDPLPPSAAEALKGLPASGWAIVTEPAWRDALAARVSGGKTQPACDLAELRRFRGTYPEGLVAPYAWGPVPGEDLLLLRARYPQVRSGEAWAPGWRLVDAGARWALFGGLAGPAAPWIEAHALRAYDPYLPLPQDRGGKEAALSEALRLAAREPDFFEALRDAGRLETDLGRTADAQAHLEAALALRPKDAQAWNDLGVALQLGGKADAAVSAFGRSIRLNPSEILPRMNLAGLEMARGDRGGAELLLRGVVRADPAFYPAVRMLARVLLDQGKREEAGDVISGIAPDSRTEQDQALLREAKP